MKPENIKAVSLEEMLEARERRAARQAALRETYGLPVVSFTMNIAGPIKNSPLIRRGFELGCAQLDKALACEGFPVIWRETESFAAGNEAFYVTSADPFRLKAMAAELEDASPMGRLFDIDVLDRDGRKISRTDTGRGERLCLICGGPAKACARSRRHTVEELSRRTGELLREGTEDEDAKAIAALACRAVLYEVTTTPKPGLVDRRNSGSHRDMDMFTFMNSASALWPYFYRSARLGLQDSAMAQPYSISLSLPLSAPAPAPPSHTFAALRRLGKNAERDMFAATGGVNTHKGAIFTVGLMCAALGRLPAALRRCPKAVLGECAAMCRGVTAADFDGLTAQTAVTTGQKLFLKYGITGVRGQAEAGFPAVLNAGLPALERGLAAGYGFDRAGAAALLAIMAAVDDTNMIARGGRREQLREAEDAAKLLKDTPYPDRRRLEALDDLYIEKNLSPGGSADLLALCYLLYFIKTEGV